MPKSNSLSQNRPLLKKDPLQLRTKLRRPQDSGEQWSISEDRWAEISIDDKRRFSHIGRIEETVDGSEVSQIEGTSKAEKAGHH